MFRCGTSSPGWFNGSHPTVNEGAVQRRVCFTYDSDCCFSSIYIRVRNCGGFYVYQLKPLTYCYSRYCGNGCGSSTPTTLGTLFLLFLFCFVLFFFHPAKNALGIYQGVRSQGVKTSGVERCSCDARVWVLPKRHNKMADIILYRQRHYLVNVSHYRVAFIYCEQQRSSKLFFSHVRFLFCSIFSPRTNICIEYSSTSVTCNKIS